MSAFDNERVFDVFISSTEKDLKTQRFSAIEVVGKLGHRVVAMERFDVGDPTKAYIEQRIKNCDLFVFILGRTFGSTTGSGESEAYVAWEYRTAQKYEKKIIAFVPHDEEMKTAVYPESVVQFREKILNSGNTVGFFRWDELSIFTEDLKSAVLHGAAGLIRNKKSGWVRSEVLDNYVEKSQVHPALISSSNIRALLDPICQFDEFVPNIDADVDEKRSVSRFFWRMLSSALESNRGVSRIYFDGGSTTFWACREFQQYCGETRSYFHNDSHKRISIATNGLPNFLELSLGIIGSTRPYRSLRLYPAPVVNENFGKTFGDLINITPKSVYHYHLNGWKIDPVTKDTILDVVKEFIDWQCQGDGNGLTILSSAGLSLNKKSLGPWVKSHRTMLQQQSIFRSKLPIVFMIDGKKWRRAPNADNGFRVLFDDNH